MLRVMAVDAQVFPVGAVGRVVGGVAVLVVNGQKMELGGSELATASGADIAVYFQRPHPVALVGGLVRFFKLP